ncbi:ABC transporter permease [Salinisphaera hydrothermalis]|uniref:Sugar ABC transporter permease n=1 Tax=Salinisphaera hydrothermalis (strain C41B8) TaxID=1304275 RepID=A0A084IPZ2_SALHC|nr:ABC transporter permease [Salinisphaera hydrothermalis]KEZ78776.1 sugar ABC transporter permease [Salinisphaera hydrothermalis C41B8]
MSDTATTHAPAARDHARRERLVALVQSRLALAVLIVVTLGAGAYFPNLLAPTNIENIVTAASFLGLIVLGQSFVLIMGGLDLSVGSMLALGTVISAYTLPYGWPVALLAPAVAGALVGLIDGTLIARAKMAPFIVTLAALLGIHGIALALAKQSMDLGDAGFFGTIANGEIAGINNMIWILLIAFALGALVLNRTRYGMALFAIGGNEDAARMMGVRVERIKIATYMLSGALAGLAGALLAARLNSGLPTAGEGYELQSIAAAVVGGVLLTGGVGTLTGALSGVLLLGLIQNIINQIGTLSASYQQLASGAFLLVAVIIQSLLSHRRGGE